MICPQCLEDNPKMFYLGQCRRCLSVRYEAPSTSESYLDVDPPTLQLTLYQKEVSDALCQAIECESVFVDAVCGAGKTEVCLPLIEKCLSQGRRIGWAIPRREVVLEIAQRLSDYYPQIKCIPVCEGYVDDVWGDLIVCTTHQLFRYHQYFDVLIIDEPDAFPFVNNERLSLYAKLACRGQFVYLSATLELDHTKTLSLPLRPSNCLLPEPYIRRGHLPFITFTHELRKHRKEMCLIFVPTRQHARMLSLLLHCPFITSNSNDKAGIIASFRARRGWLVSTTVLERGVTFPDCYVFVLGADHKTFTESSLVQIAGRAMRGMNPKKGAVYFYCNVYTDSLRRCVKRIQTANGNARVVLQEHQRKASSMP